MPLVGWICPASRERVGFGHFDTCQHGPKKRPAYSPFLARVQELKTVADVRHQTLEMTATGVMDCPRRVYLERTTKYHADPTRLAAPTRGTALHSEMARVLDPEKWSTEKSDSVAHDLRGTLGGHPVSALVDVLSANLDEIVDAKFPKDWSVRYRPKTAFYGKDGDKVAYAVQLNIARLLLAQQAWAQEVGYNPETVKLTIWDHGIGAEEGPLALECEHMSEGEILMARPWGSDTTIADHMAMMAEIRARHEALTPGDAAGQEQLAASIPLVGQTMFRTQKGGSKCDFCEVKERCDEIVRKWGRPS